MSFLDDVFDVVVPDWIGTTVDVFQEVFDDDGNGGAGAVTTAAAMNGDGGERSFGGGELIRVAGHGVVSRSAVQPLIGPVIAGTAAAGRTIARWGKGMGAWLSGNGMQIRARDLLEIVKKHGPGVAAGVLGWSVAELMSVLAGLGAFTPKKKRRRGISARDVRTTRRVCGFVQSISRSLADCRPRSHGRGRGKSGGAQFVRQG
jgi:hypothetical protein